MDEIWDLMETVSEGFLTYSFNLHANSRDNIPLKAQEIVPPGIKSDRVLSSLKRRAGYHELKLSSSNWEHARSYSNRSVHAPVRVGELEFMLSSSIKQEHVCCSRWRA